MVHDLSLLSTIGLYALANVLLFFSIKHQSPSLRKKSLISCFAGAALHVFAQANHWLVQSSPDLSLLSLLSLCALVIVLMLCFSVFSRNSLYEASLVVLPLTLVILVLEWRLPAESLTVMHASIGVSVHILSSVVAFGLLSIAGVYALFVAVIDHFLRHHHLNSLVRALPALETLEQVLFKLIGLGFVLLTISLISGMTFVDDLFGQHLVHKTVLSIMAWMVFGLLLWGRWRYGWRGRYAVRLTLAGIFLLLMAYFGSKLVLENILGRSWRN
jgi:ABC-type uncharacterized transport system permease subunit